ncbi:hypothetical protein PROFUN_09273 [Planoprotostelium fungivorum]|uniref:Uncharacterized protein n=1 Tax=Planoprotostelium fungivorum TaxID=1890364 RepID=A0A2P6NKW3_9EUKA|nr:hypothetical protein PROFUN_09273 [Planoprotostelium fungivorum]
MVSYTILNRGYTAVLLVKISLLVDCNDNRQRKTPKEQSIYRKLCEIMISFKVVNKTARAKNFHFSKRASARAPRYPNRMVFPLSAPACLRSRKLFHFPSILPLETLNLFPSMSDAGPFQRRRVVIRSPQFFACSICSYQFSRLIALGTPGHPTKLIFLTGERVNTGACEGASYTDEFSIALKLTFVHRSNNQKTRKLSDMIDRDT